MEDKIYISNIASISTAAPNGREFTLTAARVCFPMSPNNEEIVYMKANIEIAEKNLDWTPKINIDDGISETVNWIRENYKKYYE